MNTRKKPNARNRLHSVRWWSWNKEEATKYKQTDVLTVLTVLLIGMILHFSRNCQHAKNFVHFLPLKWVSSSAPQACQDVSIKNFWPHPSNSTSSFSWSLFLSFFNIYSRFFIPYCLALCFSFTSFHEHSVYPGVKDTLPVSSLGYLPTLFRRNTWSLWYSSVTMLHSLWHTSAHRLWCNMGSLGVWGI